MLETQNLTNAEFYNKAHSALIDLYATGYKLEQINLNYSSPSESDDEEFFENKNFNQIAQLKEDEVFYWEVYDPYNKKEAKAIKGWLVEDFNEIYREMKIGLAKINIGTDESIEDGLWEFKFGFSIRWGIHCISALRALHFLKYEGKGFMF